MRRGGGDGGGGYGGTSNRRRAFDNTIYGRGRWRINFYDDQVAAAFDIAIRDDPGIHQDILAAGAQLHAKGDARRRRCSTNIGDGRG